MADLVELKQGDVLLLRRARPVEPDEADAIQRLLAEPYGVTIWVLRPDEDLAVLDDEQLAVAGLQRVHSTEGEPDGD